jgi:hypothetical protein
MATSRPADDAIGAHTEREEEKRGEEKRGEEKRRELSFPFFLALSLSVVQLIVDQ